MISSTPLISSLKRFPDPSIRLGVTFIAWDRRDVALWSLRWQSDAYKKNPTSMEVLQK